MSSIVPEVNAQTRVVAILGITDADPYDGDGWLASDFCLLNQLIRDQGLEQVWFHTLDFAQTASEHGPIVHGQPHRTRKVVYQEGMTLGHLRHCPEETLKDDFLKCVQRMASDSKPGDRLLVILLGHGFEPPDLGLSVGDWDELDEECRKTYLIQTDDINNALQSHPFVSKCVISNSCFSGNWICSNSSRSAIVAVGDRMESDSFSRSANGTYRGSYFTAALCDTLRRTQCREATYKEFTGNVSQNFDHLWSFLLENNPPKFSAQYDAWEDSVPERTDLAQEQYQSRFDVLPEYPASPAEGEKDRQKAKRSRHLKNLLKKYEYIRPGRRTTASNVNVDGKINIFKGIVPGRTLDAKMQGWLGLALDHRLKLASIARWIVIEAMLLPFPQFNDWDADEWPYKNEEVRKDVDVAFVVLWRFPQLLPKPPILKPRIHQFQKPINYVAHAAANKGLDCLEFHSRLCRISVAVNPEILLPSDIYEIT